MRSQSTAIKLETIVSLAKRRGIVFPGSEIYGGLGSIWDYGPVGCELKRNIRDAWWRSFVTARAEVAGVEAAILMNSNTWEASGHVDSFSDPLAECPACHQRHRLEEGDRDRCPNCGERLGEPRQFNLMLETHLGPLKDAASRVYLRPETAQGSFTNYLNVLNTSRLKLPFGIAQIGKSFRNEITPGNFTYRTREFEQMELEYFVAPDDVERWYRYWVEFSQTWFKRFGIRSSNLRVEEHPAPKRPHSAAASGDVEYNFPWGWGELETIANRTDHDLKAHAAHSGKELSYFDAASEQRFVPYVVEPSMGVDRTALAFLLDAYDEEGAAKDTRTVLRFHPAIAPFQLAVLPLSRNEKLTPKAKQVHERLAAQYRTQYDDAQSIGRRYRRQDEIGTPVCVTIDFDTVEKDDAVTVRDRDTMNQVRVPADQVVQAVAEQLEAATRKYEDGG